MSVEQGRFKPVPEKQAQNLPGCVTVAEAGQRKQATS